MTKIQLIHGPNLNLLGTREPSVYGSMTLQEIDRKIVSLAKESGGELRILQSNSESEIVDTIHAAREWADGIVINPGALGAYSYAISEALLGVGLPAIEVHLSNIYAREEWRHKSVLSPIVKGYIGGLGWRGYVYAVQALVALVAERRGE